MVHGAACTQTERERQGLLSFFLSLSLSRSTPPITPVTPAPPCTEAAPASLLLPCARLRTGGAPAHLPLFSCELSGPTSPRQTTSHDPWSMVYGLWSSSSSSSSSSSVSWLSNGNGVAVVWQWCGNGRRRRHRNYERTRAVLSRLWYPGSWVRSRGSGSLFDNRFPDRES